MSAKHLFRKRAVAFGIVALLLTPAALPAEPLDFWAMLRGLDRTATSWIDNKVSSLFANAGMGWDPNGNPPPPPAASQAPEGLFAQAGSLTDPNGQPAPAPAQAAGAGIDRHD